MGRGAFAGDADAEAAGAADAAGAGDSDFFFAKAENTGVNTMAATHAATIGADLYFIMVGSFGYGIDIRPRSIDET